MGRAHPRLPRGGGGVPTAMSAPGRAYDVVVAGAGPAGAATAHGLAVRGWRVALIDRARFPRAKACAEYFSPGVVDCLERLGLWRAVSQVAHARLRGMELVAPGGGRHLLAYPDDRQVHRALTVRRELLDQALVEQARDAGAEVHLGFSVVDVLREPAGIAGVVVRAGSEARELSARLVIGADGSRSLVGRQAGLAGVARWPARVGLVTHFAGVDGLEDHGEMHVGRHVYCGLAPLGCGVVNVGLVTSVRRARALGNGEDVLHWALRSLPAVAGLLDKGRRIDRLRGCAPLAQRRRRPYAAGLLLVGDAAGFLDPFTGEGVFRALRGAEIAVGVAAAALRSGDVSARALAPYAQLRRRAFAAKDRLCLLIQSFVAVPALLDYAVQRLNRRSEAAQLAAALGDFAPADDVLRPRALWNLLRP